MTRQSRLNIPPVGLTIAGLDPSGGAGLVADVRTFASFACFPIAAVTSITFQNTGGVFGAAHQTAANVRAQIMPLLQDFRIACAKTGMLPTREVIVEVARLFRETELPAPVLDPVMKSTSGHDLMEDDAVSYLISDLLPLARVVTPNIPEAERLTGILINDEAGMRNAARLIREMGAHSVLVKGGHLIRQEAGGNLQKLNKPDKRCSLTAEAIDVLDDQGRVTVFRQEFIPAGQVHGSGCTLSAAICACLGKGMTLEGSVREAKRFVTEAIRNARRIGRGAKPLLHGLATSRPRS